MNVVGFKNLALTAIGRSGLIVRKFSPEILLGFGLVGGVVSAVLACKASTKASLLSEQLKANLGEVYAAKDKYPTETYPEENFKKDLALVYVQSFVEFTKLYGPSITLGAVSIALILASHGIMSKRNAALISAYKLLDESFKKYRNRVSEEPGVGVDEKKFLFDLIDGTDSEKKTELEGMELSPYAKWFDENSCQFQRDNMLNESFLHIQQTYANHRLQAIGHIFLNEVYDALGLPRTQAGCVVGWVKGKGDNFVNFGMYSPSIDNRDFINGYNTKRILLDFNVAGIMYDMI